MPTENLRKHRTSIANNYYHLVATTHKRTPIFKNFKAARILINQMRCLTENTSVETFAWVVMPDHLHWLIKLEQDHTLESIMKSLKGPTATAINRVLKRKGTLWQKGFFDQIILNEYLLKNTARYIVANPLRASLVESLKNYPHWDAVWL